MPRADIQQQRPHGTDGRAFLGDLRVPPMNAWLSSRRSRRLGRGWLSRGADRGTPLQTNQAQGTTEADCIESAGRAKVLKAQPIYLDVRYLDRRTLDPRSWPSMPRHLPAVPELVADGADITLLADSRITMPM